MLHWWVQRREMPDQRCPATWTLGWCSLDVENGGVAWLPAVGCAHADDGLEHIGSGERTVGSDKGSKVMADYRIDLRVSQAVHHSDYVVHKVEQAVGRDAILVCDRSFER